MLTVSPSLTPISSIRLNTLRPRAGRGQKHAALIVAEVDCRHKALEPRAFDKPHVVKLLYRQLARGIDLGFGFT